MNTCRYCPAPAVLTITWRRRRRVLGFVVIARRRVFRICADHSTRPIDELRRGTL